jgi:GNAT superfamily N-acetyltransferase
VTASVSRDLVIEPLTLPLWPAFEDLLDQGGPAGRCWCMAPRIGAEYRRRAPDQNRADFRQVVAHGPPPGLVAFDDGLAVGWCQLTPREEIPAVERSRRTCRVDDVAVWVISCFYVRKGHRRQGIMAALVDGALEAACTAGVPAVEAYPLDGSVSPSATATGYASTFAAAGFVEVARRAPHLPMMRYSFSELHPQRRGRAG